MNENIETIEKYCGDIRLRIQSCKSKNVAEILKENLCSELDLSCKSEMVKNVLIKYVDQIIDETFDKSGKNRTLKEI
jgi:hypothetical protein